jgi:hypothetical protein
MANITIFKKNAIADGVTVLKNLTGGGSGLSEDPDWPMALLRIPDRYSYWKTPDDLAAGTFDVDFDLGSSQLVSYVCLTNYRFYGTTLGSGLAVAEVFYAGGSTYPPAAWTQDGLYLSADENDNYLLFNTTCRYLRFEFTMPGPPYAVSFKLWAVKSADLLTLPHDWSLETELTNRRIKDVARSPSGLLFEFEPALSHASDVPGGRLVLSTASLSEWETLRDALSAIESRFIILDTASSRIYETALPGGRIEAARTFAGLYSLSLELEAHP